MFNPTRYLFVVYDMGMEITITDINANLGSFDFLEDEPELYSLKDLKKGVDEK